MENLEGTSNPNPSRNHGRRPEKWPKTNFTKAQKDRMLSCTQELRWRIQKESKGLVHQFCEEIGINKNVFKIWMHNNKHTKGPRRFLSMYSWPRRQVSALIN